LPDHFVLKFAVSDTGIGIRRENLQRIFAPFTQADASTTRRYSGTGLGLTISAELVALMGGRIWVESEENRGTNFYFTIQLERSRVPQPGTEQIRRMAVQMLRNVPVLAVDDNPTNRKLLHATLMGWCMRVDVASGGAEALEKLRTAARRRDPYRLVVIDALMPDMDGFTLIEQIREDPQLAGAILMMLSSAERRAFAERCDSLRIDAFMEKPVTRLELLRAIAAAMQLEIPDLDASERERPRRVRPAPRPLRVLVAEDTPANYKLVAALLRQRGHRPEPARDGEEALERLQQEAFDVVLMDVQMPVLDGLQATAHIRQWPDPRLAGIPIIAMTAHAMRGDRERCLAAGMDAYISKPIHAAQLLELLENLTRHGPSPLAAGGEVREPEKSSRQAPAEETPHLELDLEAARKRMGGDESLLKGMVQFFLDDSRPLLQQLERALHSGAADEVQRAAHSLKGLIANFGAEPTRHLAYQIESLAREGQLTEIEPLRGVLTAHIEQLETALRPLLGPGEELWDGRS
jgi:two-component system, sensor histidine kinase and response regulator